MTADLPSLVGQSDPAVYDRQRTAVLQAREFESEVFALLSLLEPECVLRQTAIGAQGEEFKVGRACRGGPQRLLMVRRWRAVRGR
eukprot:1281121-Rhodomonas_salina.1